MGAHRKKRRTHVPPPEGPVEDKKTIPKSFVVHSGNEISKTGNQLVRDLRKVMEPNTASRLNERRNNRIKDYLAMAGPLGVSHISLISETENSMNLRLAKFPRGPTLFFRILEYTLTGDIRAASKRPKSPGLEYATSPLLVLNNFDIVNRPEHKLVATVLQNFYPALNATRVKLVNLRRVVIYQYDSEQDIILFRHYIIKVKESGLTRLSKTLASGKLPEKLNEYSDISEYITKSTCAASDSEFDEDSVVTLGQDYLGNSNAKSSKRVVTLTEIGPRLSLKLIKVSDGLNEGKILYHARLENLGDSK